MSVAIDLLAHDHLPQITYTPGTKKNNNQKHSFLVSAFIYDMFLTFELPIHETKLHSVAVCKFQSKAFKMRFNAALT